MNSARLRSYCSTFSLVPLAVLLTGCPPNREGAVERAERIENKIQVAEAALSPTKGNSVRGTVAFAEDGGVVTITGRIENLTPGKHGFHIHETGDCSAPDASSAGGHFNPSNSKHSGHDSTDRHAGDFGNITANEQGVAQFELTDDRILIGGENSIIDKAVVIHADPDDLVSQPSGNAGKRVACGVIEIREP